MSEAKHTPGPWINMSTETKWHIGSKVPINVYEGDRPICQCHTTIDAKRIVGAMNAPDVNTELLNALEQQTLMIRDGWIPPDHYKDQALTQREEEIWNIACEAFRDSSRFRQAEEVIKKARGEQ
jgi:hypothetical protein